MKQHSPRFLDLVTEAKSRVRELTAQQLSEAMAQPHVPLLVDVREDNEWQNGHIPAAIHMGRGIIERDIEKRIPDPETVIVVYCSGGFRSALAADNLQRMGYRQVRSLTGGMQGWLDAGYTLTSPSET